MIVGILETGAPPGDLAHIHGDYATMIARLLGPEHAYRRYRVRDGELPRQAEACDAYVVTGSAAGVNDGLAWTEALADFLRSVRGQARLIGICFGHQLIAHAFGGRVEKASAGWGLGLSRYRLVQPVMGLGSEIVAMASHQDQVVLAPAGATIAAASDFTPHAGLFYDAGDALTLQFHPEFDASYAHALIDAHTAPDILSDLREGAHASLETPSDNRAIGAWLNRYLRTRSI